MRRVTLAVRWTFLAAASLVFLASLFSPRFREASAGGKPEEHLPIAIDWFHGAGVLLGMLVLTAMLALSLVEWTRPITTLRALGAVAAGLGLASGIKNCWFSIAPPTRGIYEHLDQAGVALGGIALIILSLDAIRELIAAKHEHPPTKGQDKRTS